jgi:hypothetical protein
MIEELFGNHLVLAVTLDVPQELLLPLDFENHLAMDVLDIEVFLRHHQAPPVRQDVVVEGVVAPHSICQGQRVVTGSCLLQGVDRLWLLLAHVWSSAIAHLGSLLQLCGRRPIIRVLNIHIL